MPSSNRWPFNPHPVIVVSVITSVCRTLTVVATVVVVSGIARRKFILKPIPVVELSDLVFRMDYAFFTCLPWISSQRNQKIEALAQFEYYYRRESLLERNYHRTGLTRPLPKSWRVVYRSTDDRRSPPLSRTDHFDQILQWLLYHRVRWLSSHTPDWLKVAILYETALQPYRITCQFIAFLLDWKESIFDKQLCFLLMFWK